jgi:uroporphyrinogen decarboxylase
MEPLMMDMLSEPEAAHFLLERTSYFQRCAAVQMAKAGVDIVILGDDVAGQQGLLMGKDVWAEFLRDRLAATCRAVHETSDQARVFYHSDGNIVPLIPELIECGVDILNPLQPECLDPAAVKREFGDCLCFWGAVSVQRTMSFGTPEEVRERVRTLGVWGGYILAPAHVLGPETPWENIVAFFDAANEPQPA